MNKAFLHRIQLFENFSDADLDWLLAQVESIEIHAGENLIEGASLGTQLISFLMVSLKL